MINLSKFFVSLSYLGFFPIASGTIGSFFSIILLYVAIQFLNFFYISIFFILVFIISIIFINIYSKSIKKYDSSEIVIDEFLGLTLIFIFYEFIRFTNDILMMIIIFLIFRFFDIAKIFPANWIDKNLKNSWGVILDDIVAGIYTLFILYILNVYI